jgi:hypothetical protein
MKYFAIALAVVLSSLTLAAQNNVKSEQPVVVFRGDVVGDSCPIGMRASQGVWDHTVRVSQGQQEKSLQPFGQRILLSLVESHPVPIVSATVRVRGLTGKNHLLQTDSAWSEKGDALQMMKITFVPKQDGVSSDLYVPGVTSVRSIELIEVSYKDGKTWRIGDEGVCRVKPDGIMLVANH